MAVAVKHSKFDIEKMKPVVCVLFFLLSGRKKLGIREKSGQSAALPPLSPFPSLFLPLSLSPLLFPLPSPFGLRVFLLTSRRGVLAAVTGTLLDVSMELEQRDRHMLSPNHKSDVVMKTPKIDISISERVCYFWNTEFFFLLTKIGDLCIIRVLSHVAFLF
jgi:hypothetical protein